MPIKMTINKTKTCLILLFKLALLIIFMVLINFTFVGYKDVGFALPKIIKIGSKTYIGNLTLTGFRMIN